MSYDVLHVGIDSVDSWNGGCTTHFAFEVLREVAKRFEVKLLDYPILARLNPNIPWKTRGNGAVCLRMKILSSEILDFMKLLQSKLKSYTERFYDCDPVVAILHGEVHEDFLDFYEIALNRVVPWREAVDLAQKHDVKVIKTRSGLGLIGSLAAIGSLMKGDHTYELLTYRDEGAGRLVDYNSVWTMELETWPYTFNNVDPETGRILITPRGPDPVLYGIRGENPQILFEASRILKINSVPVGSLLFRSNQGTDCHYLKVKRIRDVEPYYSICIKGEVASKPKVISGGHVIFTVSDGGDEFYCAAYKQSGDIKRAAEKLVVGDEVEVYGGVRRLPSTDLLSINLEKLVVLRAIEKVVEKNPSCPKCRKSLKSLGRRGGYKCSKCGFKTIEGFKTSLKLPRRDVEGMYLPPPRSMRHLAKPFRRYGLEKKGFYLLEEISLRRVLTIER
ncbi:MAG: tRNA(Ile)(2)-agmatinylcytidine synthase [Candidatus Nezhaarchaeales archaeon]